jgi:hypothetical protein
MALSGFGRVGMYVSERAHATGRAGGVAMDGLAMGWRIIRGVVREDGKGVWRKMRVIGSSVWIGRREQARGESGCFSWEWRNVTSYL